MPTLFTSYKRDDKVAVTKITDRLEREYHYDIWIDAVSIPGGEDWRAEIRKGIDKADVVLLMLTPDACASVQVKEEVDYARKVGRKILPLHIKKVSNDDLLKLGVEHLNYIDFVGSHDDRFAWEKLLADLPQVLARDRRLLDLAYREQHRNYLRTLYTRYGSVSLSYLLDAAPRQAVRLMDVYVPLFLGVLLHGEIKDKRLVDWWIETGNRDEIRGREKVTTLEFRAQEKRPKQFSGFSAESSKVTLIVERMEQFVAELAEKYKDEFRDGEQSLWRLESEEAPALCSHLVITGDPGSGKSTLMKHLALCLAGDGLAEGDESEADVNKLGFWPLPAYTPVFIELRALVRTAFPGAEDTVTLDKVFAYLESEQLTRYGLDTGYLKALREQMSEGDVMFFLDGLDEVPEAETKARREQVKALVHLLRGQYPQCRILVTSRPYAYFAEDWQLEDFGHVKLATLDEDRLEELALRLFRVVLGMEGAEQEAGHFKEQIAKVPESLRRNPLFFTLMAAIWLNSHTEPVAERLPVTRGAIYRRAVEMLIERWTRKDYGRTQSLVEAIGLSEGHLRQLLETLAYEVHSEQGDKDDAEFTGGTLMDIVDTLQLRPKDMWLLRDALAQRAGITYAKAPNRYQFAHRSFQEHLAACYLAQGEHYPSQIVACVREGPGLWRNVMELLPDEVRRNKGDLWALVKGLLPGKEAVLPDTGDDALWYSIYYATRLVMDELPEGDDLQEVYRPRLRQILAKLVAVGALAPAERAEMGRALAVLGDPRFGVGVRDGLPEIDWVTIPAGPFLMGSDKKKDPKARDSEMPQHEVTLPEYRMSRYPITYAQFQAFVEDPQGFYNARWWEGLSIPEGHNNAPGDQAYKFWNHPRERVSWYNAVAFCRWLSANVGYEVRLPTEAEWEKAARGTDGRIYPYGNEFDASKGDTSETGIGQTSAVGIFPDKELPYGMKGLSGNVWEWCATKWRSSYTEAEDNDLEGNAPRVLRGGSFVGSRGLARASSRHNRNPNGRHFNFGFRVVSRPPSE